jgi:hypothetical protein
MRRRLSIGAANVLAAIAVVGSGGPAIAHPEGTTVISVQGGTGALALSRTTVHAGRTTFEVSATTGRTGPLMFTPAPGVSVDQVLADGREESSDDPATAATGTRDLTRDATFYGLADVAQYAPLSVTERLPAGTYYLVDLEAPAGSPPLRVRGRAHDREEASHDDVPTVLMNSADRFVSPSVLPARGDIQVRNVSNTLHFLSLAPVNPGTTDADVQAFFDGLTDTPPFVDGPGAELNVLSPGKQARLSWNLPPGTYVMLCFIADDETGIPHAFMGMHKVVVLK